MRRMKRHSLLIVFGVALFAAAANAAEPAASLPPPATRPVDFAVDIHPLLQKNCFSCHGAEQQEGGLRLDQKKRALDGGDSGAEIVPGKSAESRLVRVIAGADDEFGQMPPKEKGKPLSAEEIGLVRAWIDQGAKWPDDAKLAAAATDHWSLKPVQRPALPNDGTPTHGVGAPVPTTKWLQHPVDAFIAARHEIENVAPSPPAER